MIAASVSEMDWGLLGVLFLTFVAVSVVLFKAMLTDCATCLSLSIWKN